jgi:hypothetical protein
MLEIDRQGATPGTGNSCPISDRLLITRAQENMLIRIVVGDKERSSLPAGGAPMAHGQGHDREGIAGRKWGSEAAIVCALTRCRITLIAGSYSTMALGKMYLVRVINFKSSDSETWG